MKSKITQAVVVIVVVVVIILGAYYFLPSKSPEDNYFKLSVVDETLPEEKIEKFTSRFNEAKLALEQDPDDYTSWMLLASSKKQVGDYKGAEAIWLHVNEIRPMNSTSFANLADLYTHFLVDYDKAEQAYIMAVANSKREDANFIHYNNFYQFYLYNLKDLKKAEAILLEGIENNPDRGDLNATAGYFYASQDNKEKAIEYFTKSLEFNPDNDQVRKELEKLK